MAGEPRIVRSPLTPEEVGVLVEENFGDMLKVVVDVERGTLAAGGPMPVDGERLLLEDGSRQSAVWGANYFPGRPSGARLMYSAMINIRPADGNRSHLIASEEIQAKVREVVERLVGPT
jgi:hypothetical protein